MGPYQEKVLRTIPTVLHGDNDTHRSQAFITGIIKHPDCCDVDARQADCAAASLVALLVHVYNAGRCRGQTEACVANLIGKDA